MELEWVSGKKMTQGKELARKAEEKVIGIIDNDGYFLPFLKCRSLNEGVAYLEATWRIKQGYHNVRASLMCWLRHQGRNQKSVSCSPALAQSQIGDLGPVNFSQPKQGGSGKLLLWG